MGDAPTLRAVTVSVVLANSQHRREWRRTLEMRQLKVVECQEPDGDLHHYHVSGSEADLKGMIALCSCVRAVDYRNLTLSNRGMGQSSAEDLRRLKARRVVAWRKAGNAAAGQG